MKKMMFAFACASALALFAAEEEEPFRPVATFETYTVEKFDGKVAGKTETGATNGDIYWSYVGTEDGSSVTAYGAEGALAKPEGVDGLGNNYLALSTEGGTLWRSVNAEQTATLGEAEDIPATGLFVDTMVQFTATEDGGAPETEAADKLAIWLDKSTDDQGVSTVALKIKAGSVDEQAVHSTATYTLTTAKPVVEGTWYRLSVKAIDDILTPNEAMKYSGFEVRIDGELAKVSEPTISATLVEGLQESEVLTAAAAEDITTGKFIVSMLPATPATTSTLQAVGFKGSGAIDNLQFTDEDPLGPDPAKTIDLTISAPNATVKGIESGKVEVGSNLVFTVTAAEGYEVQDVKVNTVAVEAKDGSYSYEVKDSDTAVAVVVTVKEATKSYPSYINDDDKGKYDTWVAKYSVKDRVDSSAALQNAYLMNIDPATTATLAIDAIEQTEDGWEITVSSTAQSDLENINGTLVIKTAETLDAEEWTESTATPEFAKGKATITVTAGNAKFMKAAVK